MKSLVFKYKKFNYFFVFLINCLTPVLLLILQLAKDNCLVFDASTKISNSIGVIDLASASVLCLFLFLFLYYLFTTLKNNRKASAALRNVGKNSRRFWIGVISTFVSWNLAIFSVVTRLIDSTNSTLVIQIITYLFAAITFFLGVCSNIYLSMFEFKWNFDIFYLRYKDTVIDKVLSANSSS